MAPSTLETKIRINIDTRDGVGNIEALNAAIKKTLQELGRSADFDALEKLRQQAADGKLNVEELDERMRELWEVYQKLSAEAADKDLLGLRAHQEIQEEIDATKAAYERLKSSGKLTSAELAQAALRTQERIRELEKQTNGWTDSLLNAKEAMAGVAGSFAGLAKVAGEAVKFEAAMAGVAKVADGTDAQIAALGENIRKMTKSLPLAADELAQIAAAGGQLGIPIEKQQAFVDLAAKMSTAFGITAEEAG
ncbi:MAG: phage tail tape measure protein, partial [Rhodocyclaceae bacterium]|nr:phage tail tape measure protein [Rhodocyclaceae bacterium]